MAIATITVTIGKTHAFSAMRSAVRHRSEWLGRLVSCPYCLSHWCALAVVLWDRPCESALDNLAIAFALVAASSVFGVLIMIYLQLLEART